MDRVIVKRLPSGDYCHPCNKARLKARADSVKGENAKAYSNHMDSSRDRAVIKETAEKKAASRGQVALFEALWKTRRDAKGKVRSAISGEELREFRNSKGNRGSLWYSQFFHILPKGTYPAYKLDDRNLILTTVAEHNQWHQARHKCVEDPAWKFVFDKYQELQLEDSLAGKVHKIK